MKKGPQKYDSLIKQISNWANQSPDIHGVFIIGSRARTEKPADEWADLDLMVIADHVEDYIRSSQWQNAIDQFTMSIVEDAPLGGPQERRTMFQGGLDVDFAFIPNHRVQALTKALTLQRKLPAVYNLLPKSNRNDVNSGVWNFSTIFNRGYRVLTDKDHLIPKLLPFLEGKKTIVLNPPSQDEFTHVTYDFWYHAVWSAKHLRRGELWWAKTGIDIRMKWNSLLPMTEWHARAIHGWDYDTWHRGRFLEQWADPRVVEGYKKSFARYDPEDCWNALLGTMELFAWMAKETADKLGYHYPIEAEQDAISMVTTLFG
ncbi:MAG TPA: aminoglycoside 6-adenylyltransferase [Bacillota bacterium]|nr:aminoglycoside 6-adenylyltransferase [Bacillota bacterium]